MGRARDLLLYLFLLFELSTQAVAMHNTSQHAARFTLFNALSTSKMRDSKQDLTSHGLVKFYVL